MQNNFVVTTHHQFDTKSIIKNIFLDEEALLSSPKILIWMSGRHPYTLHPSAEQVLYVLSTPAVFLPSATTNNNTKSFCLMDCTSFLVCLFSSCSIFEK
jgi:hypothetical protein